MFELPATRDLLVTQLADILAKNVQRVVVEVRKPIVVTRLAKESELGPEVEDLPADDLYGLVRNATIEDLTFDESESVLCRLNKAFAKARQDGFVAVAVIAGGREELQHWVGFTVPTYFMGVPLTILGEIPQDVVLIACRAAHEMDGIDKSYRLTLD